MQNNTFSADSLSQNIIVLDEVDSTNDYLKSKLSNFKPLPELTAIMAINQTQGRGQRGNIWHSQPNTNLTFSTLLYPSFLQNQEHFMLNVLISLATLDWLKNQKIEAKIKWPNDIMISNKKIGGILIENNLSGQVIRQSIIGIGINVNQMEFPVEIQNTASSIKKETGTSIIDLKMACLDLCLAIGNRITSLRLQQVTQDDLLNEYNRLLFQKDQTALYSSNNTTFQAKLSKVEKDGRLILILKDNVLSFRSKELVFILQ